MNGPSRSGASESEPVRQQGIREIFLTVLDAAPEERDAVLEASCGSDDELRREVEELLGAREDADEVLWSLARRTRIPLPGSPTECFAEGRRLGAYRLLRQIGQGGMGAVYLAERADRQFTKQVAIKLLPLGLNTGAARERFLAERQILAQLEHPGIARLLDAGIAEDGTPYFVMEYIDGESIDRYCERKDLGIAARIELILQVCAAVEHAHRSLVVHRDLKPGNILVTPEGRAKLLDFGIAKVIASESSGEAAVLTRAAGQPMTPAYASPEQIRGEPITTATDVYALGVLLYRLLAGRTPHQVEDLSPTDLEQLVCTRDPVAPSAAVAGTVAGPGTDAAAARRIARRLRGDLDTIVLMALRKEPERRYRTVAALADDLVRHREGLPVEARPNRWPYRAGKLAWRRPGAVAGVALGILALIGFSGVLAVHAERLQTERDRAKLEASRAEEVASILFEIFNVWDPASGTAQATSLSLLEQAAKRVDGLVNQPRVQAEALGVLADVYGKLGHYAVAMEFAERSASLSRSASGEGSLELAAARVRLAGLRTSLGHHDRARELYEAALSTQRRHLGSDDLLLASTLDGLATVHRLQGDYTGAEALAREVLAIRRAALGGDHPEIASALNSLAVVSRMKGDFQAARPLYKKALEMRRRLLGSDHPQVALSLNNLAVFLRSRGDYDGAEPLYREALEIRRRVYGNEHPDVATSLTGLGALYFNTGKYDAAERSFREALDLQRRIYGTEHPGIARNLGNLGILFQRQDRLREAEPLFREALLMERRLWGEQHPETAHTLNSLGRLMRDLGQPDSATVLLTRALRIREKSFGREHPEVAASLHALADVASDVGEKRRARTLFEEALAIRRRTLLPENSEIADNLHGLGALLVRKEAADEAEPLLAEALVIREGLLGHQHPDVLATRHLLADVRDARRN